MMKCKDCRDFKRCLIEAITRNQIFDTEYEGADCFVLISNADYIRSMSDEELAKEAADALSYCAPGSRPSPEGCISEMCVGCWLKWLKQPKEKEDG